MIELVNITKEYLVGDTSLPVLKATNLHIKKGEFVAILGPSGSGKSTLMHLMGILDKPTNGKILIEGKDISKYSDEELSHLRNHFVGFVFQQFNLLPKYTVLENITLPSIYSRKTLDFDPQIKALTLLKRFGIEDKAHTLPNRLSGGQQQRVAIARALIMNPEIILADEPTGNLDTKNGNTILDLLAVLNKKDKLTVIVVTHETTVAQRARRKIKIIDGEIVK